MGVFVQHAAAERPSRPLVKRVTGRGGASLSSRERRGSNRRAQAAALPPQWQAALRKTVKPER
jgi:hypothetical protein